MYNLSEILCSKVYPGRGIIIGVSANSKFAAIAYFLTGRSENSKNRILIEEENSVKTALFKPSETADTSFTIYHPLRKFKNKIIISNGSQTDAILNGFEHKISFEETLRKQFFEEDPPIYTPRISGLVCFNNSSMQYTLSIIKTNNGNPNSVQRFFFENPNPLAGLGHLITTYSGDLNKPTNFEGEPIPIKIPNNIEDFEFEIWNSLNNSYKISLLTQFVNFSTGEVTSKFKNINSK